MIEKEREKNKERKKCRKERGGAKEGEEITLPKTIRITVGLRKQEVYI